MTRRPSLPAFLLGAALWLCGCTAPAIRPAGVDCDQLGLNVRILDGNLAQQRIELDAAVRRRAEHAGNLRLAANDADGARAGQTIAVRSDGNLDELRDRFAARQAALADARALAAGCRR